MSGALQQGVRASDYEAIGDSPGWHRSDEAEGGEVSDVEEESFGRNRTRQHSSSTSASGVVSVWITLFVMCVAVCGGFIVMFQRQQQIELSIRDLSSNYKNDQGNFDEKIRIISEEVHKQRDNVTSRYNALDGQLQAVQEIIDRLNNRTTNADVLDQLKVTYSQLKADMGGMKEAVDDALKNTQTNIDSQLRSNNEFVQEAQKKARGELQETEIHVQAILDKANDQVHQLQSNVSKEMGSMEGFLKETVRRLNADIKVAEDKIASEVSMVQQNVDKYVDITNKQFAQEDDFVRFQLAGTFTMLGSLISLYHLTGHLRHYYKPEVQRRIMAVLWMVPIYGLTSWLSLVATTYTHIWDFIRDSYEAYAIYTFIALLVAIVEDGAGLSGLIGMLANAVEEERTELEEAIANDVWPRPKLHLKPPFPCCYPDNRPISVAKAWLFQCKLMALQFVFCKPLFGLVPLIFWLLSIEYEGHPVLKPDHSLDWTAPRLYELIATNTSVAIAFWGLLNFYHGMAKELSWCNPWPKFLCIKGVVFMTFWQGFGLQAMASLGYVGEKQANQLQNLLTCIEMLLASLAHFYIFPHYEWHEGYKREKEKQVLIRDTLALRDFVTDMKMMTTKWGDDGEERHSLSESLSEGQGGKSRSNSYASMAQEEKSPFHEVNSGEHLDEQANWSDRDGMNAVSAESDEGAEMVMWRDNSGKGIPRESPLGKVLGRLENKVDQLAKVSPEENDWKPVDSPPLSTSP